MTSIQDFQNGHVKRWSYRYRCDHQSIAFVQDISRCVYVTANMQADPPKRSERNQFINTVPPKHTLRSAQQDQ